MKTRSFFTKISGVLLAGLMAVAVTACFNDSKGSKDSEPVDELALINEQVKDYVIDGFNDGAATMTTEGYANMAAIVALVKPIVDTMPDEYIMQIAGHCATSGDDGSSAAMSKSISLARAKMTYDRLKAAGAPDVKMAYKGVGVDDPLPGVDTGDQKQRRVTFKAIQK